MNADAVQRRRLYRACACLVVGLAVVFAVQKAVDRTKEAMGIGGIAEQANGSLVDENEAEQISALVELGYETEVVPLTNRSELRMEREGEVVGFSVDSCASEAFEDLRAHLDERGWRETTSGLPTSSTFVKTTGGFRWLMLSCVGTGDRTAVVIQTILPKKGQR